MREVGRNRLRCVVIGDLLRCGRAERSGADGAQCRRVGGVPGQVGLAGPAPWPFARHDDPALEDLPAPDAPGLLALQRAGQAGDPDRTAAAHGLGLLQLGR